MFIHEEEIGEILNQKMVNPNQGIFSYIVSKCLVDCEFACHLKSRSGQRKLGIGYQKLKSSYSKIREGLFETRERLFEIWEQLFEIEDFFMDSSFSNDHS